MVRSVNRWIVSEKWDPVIISIILGVSFFILLGTAVVNRA